MKIAYIGDLHIDFYCTQRNPQHRDYYPQFQRYISNVLRPVPADILLVAGDIGHYNQQNIDLLIALKEHYPTIIVTYGNHEMYILSTSDLNKYNYSSKARVDEFKAMCTANDIHCLDGDTVSVAGLTISGLPMWYNLPTPADMHKWFYYLNDSRYIVEGYTIPAYAYSKKAEPFDTQAFYHEQLAKLQALPHSDILLTHVSPVIRPTHIQGHHADFTDYDIFYETDNLEHIKANYCVFGHSHDIGTFTLGSTTFLTNSIGYPNESLPSSITTFTI
mgnify:CR=1 FL=1